MLWPFWAKQYIYSLLTVQLWISFHSVNSQIGKPQFISAEFFSEKTAFFLSMDSDSWVHSIVQKHRNLSNWRIDHDRLKSNAESHCNAYNHQTKTFTANAKLACGWGSCDVQWFEVTMPIYLKTDYYASSIYSTSQPNIEWQQIPYINVCIYIWMKRSEYCRFSMQNHSIIAHT